MSTQYADAAISKITDNLIEQLELGVKPWENPINDRGEFTMGGWPINPVTGTRYSGVNVSILMTAAWSNGFDLPFWMTYDNAGRLGAQVRKGQKGTKVIHVAFVQKKDKKGKPIIDPVTKKPVEFMVTNVSTVFNARQIDNLPERYTSPVKAVRMVDEGIEQFISNTGAKVITRGSTACYYFKQDTIHMPKLTAFKTADDYYSTMFHELTHWTKGPGRVNREWTRNWLEVTLEKEVESAADAASLAYAFEELVAEMGAAFVCAFMGVKPSEGNSHASYLNHYVKLLKVHPKMLLKVASMAAAGAKFIIEQGKGSSTALAIVADVEAEPMAERPKRTRRPAKARAPAVVEHRATA